MLRYVKNGMLLLSVAYIVIGMLLLIMPETSLLWICNINKRARADIESAPTSSVCPYFVSRAKDRELFLKERAPIHV